MKKILWQILIFVLLLMVPFIAVILKADGYTDPFYLRFTTPKQSNLILGASASAQGLQPEVFKKYLNRDFYNYSFTNFDSPFGPIYLESIKKKLNKNEKNGIFIIFVTPLSICSITSNPNDSLNFRETGLCVDNTPVVNMNPNFIYLYQNFKGKYYKLFYNKLDKQQKSKLFLHEDGWLEVTVPMDSISMGRRFARVSERYKIEKLTKFKFSSLRLQYLNETIEFLTNHGKVYLVRLPLYSSMMELENELMPNFEDRIQTSIQLSNGYYNMTSLNDEYRYTDGFHLYKVSGKIVSAKIALWIKEK